MTRSLLFFGGLNFYLLSLIFLPIGFATTLVFTYPFFATYGTWLYYRQKPTVNELLLGLAGFGSLILMFTPWWPNPARFDPRWSMGVVLAFASALSLGIAQICKEKLRSKIHWIQVEYMTSLLFVIGIIPLSWFFQYLYIRTTERIYDTAPIFYSDPEFGHWLIFICIGVCSVVATYSVERARCILSHRVINITDYLQVPILYLVDALWFERGHPGVFEISGAALLFVVLLLKGMQEQPEPAEQRDELQPLIVFSNANTPSKSCFSPTKMSPTRSKLTYMPGGGYGYGSVDYSNDYGV